MECNFSIIKLGIFSVLEITFFTNLIEYNLHLTRVNISQASCRPQEKVQIFFLSITSICYFSTPKSAFIV